MSILGASARPSADRPACDALRTNLLHRPRETGSTIQAAYDVVRARITTVLLAVAILLGAAALSAVAADGRHAAVVMDINSGEVLHDTNGSATRFPASLTKMMTLFLIFEAIEEGRLTYATQIVASARAASQQPSNINLKPGERISVQQAVHALVVRSANDVATAVAEHLGGTEQAFARQMTAKARSLGMSRTVFRNASGLPDAAQVTTARDMITLALALQRRFPRHYHQFKRRSFTWKGRTYTSHNGLLRTYAGTSGIKTGYTRASGFNLVTAVERDGRRVIAAVLGGPTAAARNATMTALLDEALPRAARAPTAVATTASRQPSAATPRQTRADRAPRTPEAVSTTASDPAPTRTQRPEPTHAVRVAAVEPPRRPSLVPPPPILAARQNTAPSPENSDAPEGRAQHVAATTGADEDTSDGVAVAIVRTVPLRLSFAPHASLANEATRDPQAAPQSITELIALTADVPDRAGSHTHTFAPDRAAGAAIPAAGNAEIQIGAYLTQAEAEARLTSVMSMFAKLLDGRQPIAQRAKSGERTIYRARFAGFTATDAARACLELTSRGAECIVARSG